MNLAAKPPGRPLTESDKILSRLINHVNADMRSLELGRWYLERLRRAYSVRTVDGVVQCEFEEIAWTIARDIPRANDVTREAVTRDLIELQRLAIPKCGAKLRDVLDTLDMFDDLAFGPKTGVLRGMPGYTERSSVALPL